MGKLIRLELFNFKSYKGHHVLLFGDSYFTSIIGPNGSGKSNSMDAISFVLGIKSSHLRSAHLRDLVYRGRVLKTSKINDDGSAAAPAADGHANGDGDASGDETQSQRPGRNDPKSAWVMAVYEDDAGDEQKWKRTITNQGASEYRINERVVTAQAYNEALESENILIKARNFLVFQGDVEAIASQSPKDLTKLIEQISGSLEYKAEYERLQEEADQTAETQNYNLHKRRGINSEIKQYQEQKKEAEAFQAKADQRDEAIVTHILWKLYHFQRMMDESSATIQEHHENLKEYRRSVEKYQRTLDEAQQAQSKVSKDVNKVERGIKKREKEVEEKENSLVPVDEKIDLITQDIEKARKKIEVLSKDRDKQNSEVQRFEKDLASVVKAQKQFEQKWQETLKKQGKQLSEADFEEYNALKSEVVMKTASNKAKLDNLIRQRKTDEMTVDSLKGKIAAIEFAMETRQGDIEAIEERQEGTRTSVEELTKEVDSRKQQFNKLTSERVRLNQLRAEKEERLQEILKVLESAEAGQRQSAKEQRAKETIVALRRLYPGVRGRLGDLCKPKQKKFDEAVITALGRDFESVIVDTEKTVTECIQYLRDNRQSPMTFIPLDNIKVSTPDASLKSIKKTRLTIDTIDFDSSLERAMLYACGDSVVCDDYETARHVCYVLKMEVKAVTLQGAVIHKAGLITGGRSQEHKGNKRSFDTQDVDGIKAQALRLRTELENLPANNGRGAEDTMRSELAGLEQRLTFAKSELASFEQNLASKQRELAHDERQLEDMKPRLADKEQSLSKIIKVVNEFQSAVDKIQDKVFAGFCKRLAYSDIRAYEAQQGNLEQEVAEERSAFVKQKSTLANQITWQKAQVDDLASRIRTLEDRIRRIGQDMLQLRREKTELENSIDVDRAQITELEDQVHSLKEKLGAKTEKVIQARSELAKRSKEIDIRTKAIAALETEVQRSASGRYALLRRCKLEQINLPLLPHSRKLDSLPVDDHVVEVDPDAMDVDEDEETSAIPVKDYGIEIEFDGLDDELRRPDEEDTEEQLLQRISDLSAELEKLNPNMRAIDRLDAVEDRLKSTEKDFEDARRLAKRSRDAFNEVKEKRFDLFNKAFSHISEQISHVYKDLTRSANFPLGGQAYLDIEDSDAPYLSGIKYHAMPPLKRFRDMEHLSGGEKTMAALALLFAVHSYQPSPFFVLDEVDAALDNANVEKIQNYIREHAAPGMQFIVISLKTGLFQGSESLVGVFRDQEANSSKTLTLDLRKYR